MTTKYLTGAYPAGYLVQESVQYLDITSTASVGGYGVRDFYTNHIDNKGSANAAGWAGNGGCGRAGRGRCYKAAQLG